MQVSAWMNEDHVLRQGHLLYPLRFHRGQLNEQRLSFPTAHTAGFQSLKKAWVKPFAAGQNGRKMVEHKRRIFLEIMGRA